MEPEPSSGEKASVCIALISYCTEDGLLVKVTVSQTKEEATRTQTQKGGTGQIFGASPSVETSPLALQQGVGQESGAVWAREALGLRRQSTKRGAKRSVCVCVLGLCALPTEKRTTKTR